QLIATSHSDATLIHTDAFDRCKAFLTRGPIRLLSTRARHACPAESSFHTEASENVVRQRRVKIVADPDVSLEHSEAVSKSVLFLNGGQARHWFTSFRDDDFGPGGSFLHQLRKLRLGGMDVHGFRFHSQT